MAQLIFTKRTDATSSIPDGWHEASIAYATVKTMKNGTNKVIIEYSTPAGNITEFVAHETEIGANKLSVIMDCVGLEELTDTDQLIGRKLRIRVENSVDLNGKPWCNVREHEKSEPPAPPHKFTPTDTVPF